MPTLEGDAKQRYISAYGAEAYERWCDSDSSMHGGEPPKGDNREADVPFKHMPCHDVESIFWTFLYTLLFAQPTDGQMEVSLNWAANVVRKTVLEHIIEGTGSSGANDERRAFMMLSKGAIDESLHPTLQLRGLGELLHELAKHVAPEYAYLTPHPHLDHLHEAFRRILLAFIVDLEAHPEKDVVLNPDVRRPIKKLGDKADGKLLGKRVKHDGRLVLPTSKRTRGSSYGPSAEVNGSRVISTPSRNSAASSGLKKKSSAA